MSKFCSNCGKEINENAVICVNCGVAVNNMVSNKKKTPGKGLGIASMVLGIIAIFYGMISILMSTVLLMAGEYFYFEEKIIVSIVFNFLPFILSIIGISLGLGSISKVKSGMNITGIILNTITIIVCILSVAFIIIM